MSATPDAIKRIGIRVALYDDTDWEIAASSTWVDPAVDDPGIRALYDECAAALWPALQGALDALRKRGSAAP